MAAIYIVQKQNDTYVVVNTKANFVIRLAATGKPYTFATEAEAQAFADTQNEAHERHGNRH